MTAEALFRRKFDAAPDGVWSAPGRVNLIGEHTDYTGGLVLPFAIDARASVAVGLAPHGSREFRIVSAQRKASVLRYSSAEIIPGSRAAIGWQAYVLGVIWSLRSSGCEVPPLDIALDSTVPGGAGLSSSAAVECAVTLAVSDLLDLGLDDDRARLARIAQRAENDFVGVPCGLMDQMASAASTAGHALFFDIGADHIEHIPFAPDEAGVEVVVIDTRSHHSLADGEYAKRRRDTEAAAQVFGVALLSHVDDSDLPAVLDRLADDQLRRRTKHVLTENQRVREAVDLLRAGAIAEVGPLLSASHASLRDDFEVSCAELNIAAETAESAGAFGARMVGGGFGGSVIALAPLDRVAAVTEHVINAFADRGFTKPVIRTVHPAVGAHRDR